MGKLKVKVYFYHLFILAVVMLLCFYLMYRDIKRIEANMLNLYNRCNDMDKLLKKQVELSVSQDNTCKIEENVDVNNMNNDTEEFEVLENDDIVEETDDENNNVTTIEDSENEDAEEDAEEDVEEDGEEEDVEENVVEGEDEEEGEDEVDNLLKKIAMVDDENNTDEVDALLDTMRDNEIVEDYSKMSREELMNKTNNDLRLYLKSQNKATVGKKDQLIDLILN